eukprot:jgi/Botrbrau1/22533/Bobra.114_2s0057.1
MLVIFWQVSRGWFFFWDLGLRQNVRVLYFFETHYAILPFYLVSCSMSDAGTFKTDRVAVNLSVCGHVRNPPGVKTLHFGLPLRSQNDLNISLYISDLQTSGTESLANFVVRNLYPPRFRKGVSRKHDLPTFSHFNISTAIRTTNCAPFHSSGFAIIPVNLQKAPGMGS